MLGENIKALRKQKGYSQEFFAERLHVVRQTVSKWEKGYSVPDAAMLEKIAGILETDVSVLLGGSVDINIDTDAVAQQLANINEQLAIKNRRARNLWKVIGIATLVVFIIHLILVIIGVVSFNTLKTNTYSITEEYIKEDPNDICASFFASDY